MASSLGAQSISDKAVLEKTGRSWSSWRRVLDAAGAPGWTHKATAAWLQDEHGLGGWWAQTVTVRYEQDVKGRPVGSASDGTFQLGATRTFASDQRAAYGVFRDARRRRAWLRAAVNKAGAAGKRLVEMIDASWDVSVDDPPERVRFHVTGARRGKLIVELRATKVGQKVRHVAHIEKIPSARARDELKASWGVAMDVLRQRIGQ